MTDWGYRAAACLARRLPPSWSDAIADAVADIYVWTHPRVAGRLGPRLERSGRGTRGTRATYRAFARAVRDFLRDPFGGAGAPGVSLDAETRAILRRAREDAMPTLVVSGHFGPWELALGWLAREVGPLVALAAPHRHRAVERFFDARRAAAGIRTLSGRSAAAAALSRLRAGGWIAALADRACAPRRRIAGLSGAVPIDRSPLVLARRAGARVLAGVSWRGSDGALHVKLDEPFLLEPRRGGLSFTQAAARLQGFFDRHVVAHPTQWFDWADSIPVVGSETGR